MEILAPGQKARDEDVVSVPCTKCNRSIDRRFGYCPWCGTVQWNDPEEESADALAAAVAIQRIESAQEKLIPWEEVAEELGVERENKARVELLSQIGWLEDMLKMDLPYSVEVGFKARLEDLRKELEES